MTQPPQHIIDFAILQSTFSPCQSKRGVVIFDAAGHPIAWGYNFKPRGFDCDGTDACKATCRVEAIHAEQMALVNAGRRSNRAELIHVKSVDGQLVSSGPPSCVECSKLMLAAGIAVVWLYHGSEWCRYETADFHQRSLVELRLAVL